MKTLLDPYAPIEKAPLFAPDSMRSRGHSVRIEDASAEGGWREVGVVSPSYLLVPNAEVRRMAADVAAASGMAWSEDRVFFDGKRFLYALVADPEEVYAEVAVGDVLGVGLLFENSYDGSRRLGCSLFVHRLACANGMLAPDLMARLRFRHDRANAGWQDDLGRAMDALGAAPERLRAFARAAARLARYPVGSAELARLRHGPLARLPVSTWGRVADHYLANEEPTGWGVANAVTSVLWHADKPTLSDFAHNEAATTALVRYAADLPSRPAPETHGADDRYAPRLAA
ncbi:MAG TPA: DUF932 domain-containing protein [Bacteroidetes bacterium]|nr:DUF932 domain-containing protein [Bacteroidota bacterium]